MIKQLLISTIFRIWILRCWTYRWWTSSTKIVFKVFIFVFEIEVFSFKINVFDPIPACWRLHQFKRYMYIETSLIRTLRNNIFWSPISSFSSKLPVKWGHLYNQDILTCPNIVLWTPVPIVSVHSGVVLFHLLCHCVYCTCIWSSSILLYCSKDSCVHLLLIITDCGNVYCTCRWISWIRFNYYFIWLYI